MAKMVGFPENVLNVSVDYELKYFLEAKLPKYTEIVSFVIVLL